MVPGVLLMTCVTVGVDIGDAEPITSMTVLELGVVVLGMAIHKLPAVSTEMEAGAAVPLAGSIGVVSAEAPALVSAVTVPLPLVIHVMSLPSMARAVADEMPAPV